VDLRKATLALIFGTAYTVLHKAAHWLFPVLGARFAGTVTSILWLGATSALVLFAYEFLKEVRPLDRRLRYSLVATIVLTGCVILSKLQLWPVFGGGVGHRLLFSGASTLNAFALLVFAVSLAKLVPRDSSVHAPLCALVWALGITIGLRIASVAYLSRYLLTGEEVEPLPFLQPLAMLSFLFTHGMTLWFLIRFWRIGSYGELVPHGQVGGSAA
jgi:hypothetical protein